MAQLSKFGKLLESRMHLLVDHWEITEATGVHPFDHILTVKTPGFEMPDDARKAFDEIAYENVPAVCRMTFVFSSEEIRR